MTGKLKNGYEFTISEDVLKDWHLMEAFAELEENPFAGVKLAKLLLADQYKEFIKSLEDENGRADATAVTDAISEILSYNSQTKNS